MSKAERRKRARQRAKERLAAAPQAVAAAAEADSPSASPSLPVASEPASGGQETGSASSPPIVAAVEESGFITGPIAPPAPVQRAQPRLEVPGLIDAPIELDEDDEDDDEESDPEDELDGDEDDGDDDADEDDEDGDGDDEDEIDDALVDVACGAIEQGAELTWNELIQCVCKAEVTDPRLALLVSLLVTQDDRGQPAPLTGERVLSVLEDLELGDLVEEARELTTLAPEDGEDSPEEQALVRTTARELAAQAKVALASPAQKGRPVRASDIRQRQSALGVTVPAPPPATKIVRSTVSDRFRARRSAQ